jgi:hypothetical protein
MGSLRGTGLRPTFLHKFEKRGVALPVSLFGGGRRPMDAAGAVAR